MSFEWTPDYGATKNMKPRVATAKFGDGYKQRVQHGINTTPQIWTVRFSNRDEAEATAIDEFLLDLVGVDTFEWTPPGEATEMTFICEEWSKVLEKGNVYTVSATFEQVYDP